MKHIRKLISLPTPLPGKSNVGPVGSLFPVQRQRFLVVESMEASTIGLALYNVYAGSYRDLLAKPNFTFKPGLRSRVRRVSVRMDMC